MTGVQTCALPISRSATASKTWAEQWCSHGYWKNHTAKWDGNTTVALKTTTTFMSVFGAGLTIAQTGISNTATLLDVLNMGGGGKIALARAAVNEALNVQAGLIVASNKDTLAKIVAIYQVAILRATYSGGEATLNAPENCPLGK